MEVGEDLNSLESFSETFISVSDILWDSETMKLCLLCKSNNC